MQRIKISEQDLNRIINESVKKVLKEGGLFNMEGGYNAMKNNLGQTKGQGFGTRVAKDLAEAYTTWTAFRAETDYTKIDGIGEVMNNNLLSFDYIVFLHSFIHYTIYYPIFQCLLCCHKIISFCIFFYLF